MFKFKSFLSLTALMIGGLVGALLPTHFSVAQSFGLNPSDLWNPSLTFTMPDYSVYLYAVTEANTYTISFDANGGVGSMTGLDMTYDKAKLLPKNTFTNEGLSFLGWSENPGGPVQYLDQKGVKNLTTEDGGEVILYAQWGTQVSYTVEYYKENLEGGYDVVTGVQYGASDTVGVAEELSFTGFTYDSGNVNNVTTGIINDDGSLVLVMYYTRNEYSLTIKDRDDISVITGIKYGADIPLPSDPEWTGNFFDGWDNLPEDGKMPDNDLVIESTWTYGEHTITFDTDGGTEVDPITRDYGDPILPPENPTKEGYEFVGWEPTLPDTMPYDDIVVKAIWKEVGSGKGWSGGGGRGGGTSDTSGDQEDQGEEGDQGDQEHGSSEGQSENKVTPMREDLDVFFAYMWAHDMGIIDGSWEESDPDGYVTRGAMAEMVVRFTDKILGREIPSVIPAKCAWGDAESEWKSPETKAYAEKSCAIGVMGIRMVDFMPNKILDRAEFGTILSRLLWGDKYDVVDATKTKLYYTRHLNALSEKKIMTEITNPEARKELRKWAWLMLMRSRVWERQQL